MSLARAADGTALYYEVNGRSDKPKTGYDTRTFAGDVIAILDDLGVGRAHVSPSGSPTLGR